MQSTAFSGAYDGTTPNEAFLFGEVSIVRHGPKLAIVFDGLDVPLTKQAPGQYTFESEDFHGDCDNPGCSFVVRVSGTVAREGEGAASRPVARVKVTEMFPHPESEGDPEGEHDTDGVWARR